MRFPIFSARKSEGPPIEFTTLAMGETAYSLADGGTAARVRPKSVLASAAMRSIPLVQPPRSRTVLGCAVCLVFVLVGSFGFAADSTVGLGETPLAPASGPRGPTMFARLSAEETGVVTENRYADPKMWGELYQEFLFGAVGTGVAVGDYDGDGRPDIFVVSKTESCRLFRNQGGWKFEDVTERSGVGDKGAAAMIWKGGASFVDVNNDGRLDLYVCRFNARNLLYVNQGDGTFREMAHAYSLDLKDCCGMASFCDYDRDGWLDVYVATNLLDAVKHPNGQRGYLLHNDRDGTFSDVTESAGIGGESCSHSATWWDHDNDAWPDLYVANDYGVPDRLYRNNRDGTFSDVIDTVVPHTSFSSMGSDVGDVNNDGLLDFFVADMFATTHEKDQRGATDLRDRDEELSVTSLRAPKYRRNALLLNSGRGGRCQEVAFLAGVAATDWTWSSRLEDLDADGRLDLFIPNGMIREQNIDVNTRMMRAENTAERIRIMRNSPVLHEANLAYRNLGDLAFENASAAWGLDQKGITFGAAFGDFDGDGDLDLVCTNFEAGATVLRNDTVGGHRVNVELRGTVSNRSGVGAIVRIETASGPQVRQLWLARGYMSSSEPAAFFGVGADTHIERLVIEWPSGHKQTFANLPVDRRFTVTEPASPIAAPPAAPLPPPGLFEEVGRAANLTWLSRDEQIDETTQQRLLPVRLNRRGPALGVADIDGDGDDDICIGGTTQTPARILRGDGPMQFTVVDASVLSTSAPVDDGPVLFFDAAGNGNCDLLVTKGGNSLPADMPEYQPRLFFNNGAGVLRPAPAEVLPALQYSIGAVAAADFDRDGRLDVFVGARLLPGLYPLAPRSALLSNQGSRFADVTDTRAAGLREVGLVTGALWSDVDDDGWLDLLVALEWGPVKCFHNEQGRTFVDWTERLGFAAAGSGWWTAIAAADLNGDGQPDYVVGNVGLNTPYRADPHHPALMFLGDFVGDGAAQLIEGYYEGESLFPRRSRRELSAVIPAIRKKYLRNDDFARATLPEILGEEALANADRFVATEFRSGVFMSRPEHPFVFVPLPRAAQIAPVQGVAVGDFDGDGNADIYAVQNSFAPIPAIGRFDGGLSQLLRGDGHGSFAVVPPVESDLIVPGDAKALVVIDLNRDGRPDFVVSRGDNTTLAFRNRGGQGRNGLGVRLRGPAGNPTAVGARVTLELADGLKQTTEVCAGSGYYSQSSATCFFGYPDGNLPKQIQVRWPSGAVTIHTASSEGTVTLTAPAP